jgi:hypothetical protein
MSISLGSSSRRAFILLYYYFHPAMLEITYPEIDDPTFPAAASRLCEAE